MIITVLIPTYHRTRDLARCLEALEDQTRAPDEILLVVRDTDSETRDMLARREHSLCRCGRSRYGAARAPRGTPA